MITFKQYLSETAATPENVDTKFTVGAVAFDNDHGMGATPNNGNVAYMGAVAWMSAANFRKLAHAGERADDARRIEDLLRGGNAIGCPFLDMKEIFDKDDVRTAVKVMGHEGRARADAFAKLNGTELMPVHLFFRGGSRARDLTDELFKWIAENGLVPEGAESPITSGIRRVFVAGRSLRL